jgi:hypothetical protein
MSSVSKQEREVGGVADCLLTEEMFMRRCRGVAISDALKLTLEAIGHDKRCEDVHVAEHLELAKDALLDALSGLVVDGEGA